MSKDDQCTLVSTLSNKLLLFDKQSGELLSEYKGHANKIYQIENCMNNISSEIYSGSEDGLELFSFVNFYKNFLIFYSNFKGFIYIWDLVDSKIKQKLKHANEKTVHSLSFHPEENKLISAQEQFVYLWSSAQKE